MSDQTTSPTRNVCTEVVAHDLCVGCGMCAGICPNGNLTVEFNQFGEYAPRDKGACAQTCDLCLQSCPAWCEQADNEDTLGRELFAGAPGIKHRPEVGYYLSAVMGYSDVRGHRGNGASGGLATWTLERLLGENRIDKACCVRPTSKRGRLFEFVVCGSPEEIRSCAGSSYYPVQTSEIVRHILSNEGRYAVVGLPCCIKAFRLAMRKHPKLRRRVKFLLGLVCGQGKSSFFAEYACALGGGDPARLDEVRFRIEAPKERARDHGIRFRSDAGSSDERRGVVRMSAGPAQIWTDRCFTPNGCNFCDDTFAELADATFMDAWLPAYENENRGTSIVIARNEIILNMLRRGTEQGELTLSDLGLDEVVASQRGVVHTKRRLIHQWCRLAAKEGRRVPPKRGPISSKRLPFLERRRAGVAWRMCMESRRAWPAAGKDVEKFERAMSPFVRRSVLIRALQEMLRRPWKLPLAVLRRIRRSLGGRGRG